MPFFIAICSFQEKGRTMIEALRLFLIACIFLFAIGGIVDNEALKLISTIMIAWVGLPIIFISNGWMEKRDGRFWLFFCVGILVAFESLDIFTFLFSIGGWLLIEAEYLLLEKLSSTPESRR